MKSCEFIHLPAYILSWMAKCPIAKNNILYTHGSMTYTTPFTVDKLKSNHDKYLEIVNNAILDTINSLSVRGFRHDPVENYCLDIVVDNRVFNICGRFDTMFILYGEKIGEIVALVVETTLSPSVKHIIYGEMLFYITAVHLYYGCRVAGLVINPRRTYLIVPKTEELKRLIRLFQQIEQEKALELAEKKRKKYPWMCSLCDLKQGCPLGVEI